MRLKCRCKVEVMNSLEGTNSWHTAEVLSGDGRTYTVRYDSCSRFENSSMEVRVPKKFIRPYPPPVQSGEIWQVSDLVEVCSCDDVCSWKAARVLMILGGDRYLVRLLGCSQEISIHKSRMRRRQCWKDGKWFLLPKDSGSYGHIKYREPPSDCWTNINGGSDHVAFEDITRLHDSHVISSRSLKRMSPHYSSAGETYPQEFGALGTNCKRRKINSPQSLKKVDAVAYPRERLGGKYMHASINVRSNAYNKIHKQNLETEYSDSTSGSSVGSCSVNRHGCHIVPDRDALCSDAESIGHLGDEFPCFPPQPEYGFAETIHRIELHAYRCTLEALYASGPLTWEKQTLLTNLLIELHISDDEHLTELKNLISRNKQG
ncbi:hypothetical protein DM860_007723 [Cuscuta australis]|uniref:ENT domain-containing protein n=1 Tax=Cuscuta australis TaxID=267555 RepID=A0A328E4R4_9ASTE|nr:hypothetical protein DM860_007723 [Cuscuta australis]